MALLRSRTYFPAVNHDAIGKCILEMSFYCHLHRYSKYDIKMAKKVSMMKSLYSAIFVILAFSFASGVSADRGITQQKPESILVCTNLIAAGAFSVLNTSIPSEINTDQCRTWEEIQPPDLCALCVGSLESQGCKIIDVNVAEADTVTEENSVGNTKVTYLISCSKP